MSMRLDRRQCLAGGALLLCGAVQAADDHPFAPFDREVEAFMRARKVPGGSLAVVKDRRLVYAKGYGFADPASGERVRAESLFRIASIAKPITAVAVMKLVEKGRMRLEDRAIELLDLKPLPGERMEPKLARITVRHLLHHTGGWDRGRSGDPMFQPRRIARTAGVPEPASAEAVVRYMLGRPLDFDPGTAEAYSNFGYCVLGRIIAKLSGQSYEQFVRHEVLRPAEITGMRIGSSLMAGRARGEVRYAQSKPETTASVFPPHHPVSWPDGGFHLEAMDAHGGWIASAVDLVRFAAALEDPQHSPILKGAILAQFHETPEAPVARKADGSLADSWTGLGWRVRPVREGRFNYWHSGSLPGTNTLLVRRWDGLTWAALFNLRSEDEALPDGDIDRALHRAAAEVKQWPDHNLFSRFT